MLTSERICVINYIKEGALSVPDYKKMYLALFKASEDAINLLVAAQRECEELYMASEEPKIALLPAENDKTP